MSRLASVAGTGGVRDPLLARVAVVHGRFQPLHLGHLEYLLAGKRACETLVVGITNPDPMLTVQEASDIARGRPESNPCTFYERHLMVERALLESEIPRTQFQVVPFPHGRPELLRHYVPPSALHLLTIYDAWGEVKLARLSELGFAAEVLWRRETKLTTGATVRGLIAAGDDSWEKLVPAAVVRVVREMEIDKRIGELDGR